MSHERSSIAMTTSPVATGSMSGGVGASFAMPSPSAAAVRRCERATAARNLKQLRHTPTNVDAAAFGIKTSEVKQVTRTFWSDRSSAGEVLIMGSTPKVASTTASLLVKLLEQRVSQQTAATPWSQLETKLAGETHVSRAQALEAFSLAIAKLPGVATPTEPRGSVSSGTIAVDWLIPYLKTLTAKQRGIVHRALPQLADAQRAHAAHEAVPYSAG